MQFAVCLYNKGEFLSSLISAFVSILALNQSERANREVHKQTQAVTFELLCKWILNIFHEIKICS